MTSHFLIDAYSFLRRQTHSELTKDAASATDLFHDGGSCRLDVASLDSAGRTEQHQQGIHPAASAILGTVLYAAVGTESSIPAPFAQHDPIWEPARISYALCTFRAVWHVRSE